MPWSNVIGQAEAIRRLSRSASSGRLGHAYAFVGPPGIGKKQTALAFAQTLLCPHATPEQFDACGRCSSCQQVDHRSHPDLMLLELPPDRASHPIAAFVGEREERKRAGLCYEIALHPLIATRRVAILDEAEALNDEGANALLKTLEEPPPWAVIILVVAGLDLLLPTIRSRCQVVTFEPLSATDLTSILTAQSDAPPARDLAHVLPLAEGSLTTARQLLDPGLRQQRQTLYEYLAAPRLDVLALSDFVKGAAEESSGAKAGQRSHAGWVARFCIEFYRQALLALSQGQAGGTDQPEVARFLTRFPERSLEAVDLVVELLERCLIADRQLESNASLAMCLESLFQDLGRLLKPA